MESETTERIVPDNKSIIEKEIEVGDGGDEEMDDLFGDDSNDDNDDTLKEKSSNNLNIDQDSDDEDEEEEGTADEEEELKQADLTLERHPRSHKLKDNNAFNFPLPRFLFVDPTPFTPNIFEQQLKDFLNDLNYNEESLKSSIQFQKLKLNNTIRWRYAKTKSNDLFKQSNANIIEWEDGSMSLKLGNEYFDIKTKLNDDNLLAFKTPNNKILMSLINLNKSIQILPPSMNSKAHKILANTLTKNMKMKKSKRINTIVTNEDPELKAREVEKIQKEIEKSRRRQLLKLQLQEERNERRSNNLQNNYYKEDSQNYEIDDVDIGDEYDDDDDDDNEFDDYGSGKNGFVVNDDDEVSEIDDDELDKAADRLKQVKRNGAAKYRKHEELEDEVEEGEEYDDDDDDDDGAIVRKKRKIVVDEDDE